MQTRCFLQALLSVAVISAFVACSPKKDEPILERAIASQEFREGLIADYRTDPGSFKEDRLLAVGIACLLEDRLEEAEEAYKHFLVTHPDHPRALRGLGSVKSAQGSMKEALDLYERAWSMGDAQSLAGIASVYINTDRYEELERFVPDIRKYKHVHPDVATCLIVYAIKQTPPDGALVVEALDGYHDHKLLCDPNAFLVIWRAYSVLARSTNTASVLAVIRQRLIREYESDPQGHSTSAMVVVADCYMEDGHVSRASELYEDVLAVDSDNVDALRGYGALITHQGDYERAMTLFRRAWGLGDETALNGLAATHVLLEDYEGLNDLVPELVARKHEDPEFLNSLIVYCIYSTPPNNELFVQALEDVTDEEVLARDDTTRVVLQGLEMFGDKERLARLRELVQKRAAQVQQDNP